MMDKIQSQTIDLLRFPMAVFVVFIHTATTLELTPINETSFPLLSGTGIYNMIEITTKSTLPIIAVPVFFVISGFLFFQKLEEWNWEIYKTKMQSRIRTLLIPYICWTILSFLVICGIPTIETFINSGSWTESLQVLKDNRCSIIGSFWDGIVESWKQPNWIGIVGESSYPLIVPLWFVRDLMVVMVLSPLLFMYFKKTKICGLIILGLCYISGIWPKVHGFSITSFFYYGMGCYLAINKLNIVEIARKLKNISLPIAIFTLCIIIYYCSGKTLIGARVKPFYVISGVWSAIFVSSYLVTKWNVKPNKFLVSSCFFVYALHVAPYDISRSSLLGDMYQFVLSVFIGVPHVELLQYLLPPVITIAICLGLFWLLQRFTPKVCGLLTGNRS